MEETHQGSCNKNYTRLLMEFEMRRAWFCAKENIQSKLSKNEAK